MIPDKYPPQQSKSERVIKSQRTLAYRKVIQEEIADAVAVSSKTPVTRQFAEAIAKSNRLMAEDILRESGYMLPQSVEARELLKMMLEISAPDFPIDSVKLLLNKL